MSVADAFESFFNPIRELCFFDSSMYLHLPILRQRNDGSFARKCFPHNLFAISLAAYLCQKATVNLTLAKKDSTNAEGDPGCHRATFRMPLCLVFRRGKNDTLFSALKTRWAFSSPQVIFPFYICGWLHFPNPDSSSRYETTTTSVFQRKFVALPIVFLSQACALTECWSLVLALPLQTFLNSDIIAMPGIPWRWQSILLLEIAP